MSCSDYQMAGPRLAGRAWRAGVSAAVVPVAAEMLVAIVALVG